MAVAGDSEYNEVMAAQEHSSDEPLRFTLTGGATGGHLFPLVAVATVLRREAESRQRQLELTYVGVPPFRPEVLQQAGVVIYPIAATKLRRYLALSNFIDLLKFPFSLIQSLIALYRLMPDALLSKGGPGSIQVVLAAWFFRIPILIHETDSIPGRANRFCARLATRIGVSFEAVKEYFPAAKLALVGNPIDPDFDRLTPQAEDYDSLKLDRQRKIVLVVGGSQGAQRINEVVVEAIPSLLPLAQIVHQIGEQNFQQTRLEAEGFILEQVPAKKHDYHPFGFIPHQHLVLLLKMADLIISRAGGFIFEIAAAGKASVLVPLSAAVVGRHQLENAYAYANTGACTVIEEANLTPHILTSIVEKMLADNNSREQMAAAARAFAKPAAAETVARELLYLSSQA